jgi:DNA repair protein RadA/Sms
MAKSAKIYECSHCGAQYPKWVGQCSECGKWGTVQEEAGGDAAAPTALASRADTLNAVKAHEPTSFAQISTTALPRVSTGIAEVDRVLGGGVVPGGLLLLGGDPGIGKSTIVAQMAQGILNNTDKQSSVLYVSGEESGHHIAMRLQRLGITDERLTFLAEQHIEVIVKTAMEYKPSLLIVDSIQTVASSLTDGEPGSVNQLKACTVRLLEFAKSSNIPVLIIGHVTKGGELGGPKTLEHIVDTVMYLEGDRFHQYRLLRAVKNRFGSTSEIGVFEMVGEGLREVTNASELFVQERSKASGSVMTTVVEGSRIFLVEVQALVNRTNFGYPQRKSSGFDLNRLNLLLAVLQRRAGLPVDTIDVYVNVVGGMRFVDPGMDAAVCLAIASALHDVVVPSEVGVWGEVGLGGEIRTVGREDDRQKEAKRFGLTKTVSAKNTKTVDALLRIIAPEKKK